MPSSDDYLDCLERICLRRIEFTDLVAFAERMTERPALAAVLYQTWLQRSDASHKAPAWFNLGVLLFSTGDVAGARQAYESALALNARFVQARFNLGLTCERHGAAAEALEHWHAIDAQAAEGGVDDQSVHIAALNSIGRLQETLRQYGPACEALEKSLRIKPDQPDAIHHLVFMRQKQCRWPIYEPVGEVTAEQLRKGTSALAMLNISDDPAAQLEAALNYSRRKIPPNLPKLAPAHGYRHDRIRIAYCSGDFCTHPVAMLTVGLFENHDHDRFETFAFCWSPNDGSALRQRIVDAVDHYVPVHDMSELEIAKLIREHEIDVLIDLQGQTSGAKTTMLAYRPAPVQITYLGLPATTGLPCIDYVIADHYLIPPEHARFYSEQPLYMPDIYQVSDRKRPHNAAPARAAVGLPEDRFVFCSFNNNHKYTLEVFSTWMNILRQVPDSVLWLLSDNRWAQANLQQQAREQGVDPARLVFAERALPADYLARYLVADLFLDTFPFNAGTTANDALWMGLPVVTVSGRAFAARMAGALLTAAGLPELITTNLVDYERKAVELAGDAQQLAALRQRLADARNGGPLFDSTRFTRELELQLTQLVTRSQSAPTAPRIEDHRPAESQATPEVARAGVAPTPDKRLPLSRVAEQAEQALAKGERDEAIRLYREWLSAGGARSGDAWLGHFNLGIMLRDGGDWEGAAAAFKAVVTQRPDFRNAHLALQAVNEQRLSRAAAGVAA